MLIKVRERRIQKHQVPGLVALIQKPLGARVGNPGPGRAKRRCVVLERKRGFAVAFDKHAAIGAAGQRFEAKRAAAGIQVSTAGTVNLGDQPVEKCFTHPAQSGSEPRRCRETELPSLPQTTDNAYFVACHAPVMVSVCS